eukprot:COSAG01_NODE_69459_length_261_cov_0.734568_2_plen_27_part_01
MLTGGVVLDRCNQRVGKVVQVCVRPAH